MSGILPSNDDEKKRTELFRKKLNKVKHLINNDNNYQNNYNNHNNRNKYKKIDGMIGNIKIFDKTLYEKYDKKSREHIKSIFKEDITDNTDIYKEDMIVITDKIPFKYIELQVYSEWRTEFPYKLPFIYERKMKYSEDTLFICFNSIYDQVIIFSKKMVSPNSQKIKINSNEYIHCVPWSNVVKTSITNLSYELINKYVSDHNLY